MTKSRLVVMAGGTGGHVFPALAVARELQAKGWDIHWLGTKRGMEAQIVPKAGIPLYYLTVKGVRRNGFWTYVLSPFQITWAIKPAKRLFADIARLPISKIRHTNKTNNTKTKSAPTKPSSSAKTA